MSWTAHLPKSEFQNCAQITHYTPCALKGARHDRAILLHFVVKGFYLHVMVILFHLRSSLFSSSAGLTCAYLTGRALQVLGFFIAHNFIAHYAVSLFRFVATLCFGTGVAFLFLQGGGGGGGGVSGSSALISARQLGVSFVNGLLLSAYLVGLFFGLQHAGTVRYAFAVHDRIFQNVLFTDRP